MQKVYPVDVITTGIKVLTSRLKHIYLFIYFLRLYPWWSNINIYLITMGLSIIFVLYYLH